MQVCPRLPSPPNGPSNLTVQKLVLCSFSRKVPQNPTTLKHFVTIQLLASFHIEWRSLITSTVKSHVLIVEAVNYVCGVIVFQVMSTQ